MIPGPVPPATDDAGRRGRTWALIGAAVLAVIVAAEAAFIIRIPQFVAVDAATHVGGAALLRDILEGAGALHLRYVQLSTFPAPNILPELALGIVMVVVDPTTAEKLLQISYVILLPVALLYAARGVRREGQWVAFLALPMTFTFAFHYGFYDFTLGVVVFLLVAGFAWRHRASPGARHAIVLGLLALLLYLTHIVPYAAFVIFIGSVAGWRVLLGAVHEGPRAALGELRRWLPAAIGMAPSLILAAVFFAATGTGVPVAFNPLLSQLAWVATLATALATFDRLEILVSVVLALTLLVLSIHALWVRWPLHLQETDSLLVFAILMALAAMVAPREVRSGGSFIPERLTLFAVYGLALWLAASHLGSTAARLASATWIAIAIAFFALRLPSYLNESRAAEEYESVAPCIADGATMVQVNLAYFPSGSLSRTDPFTAETGRLSAVTRGHDLGNFEGLFPFFLFTNRPQNDPYLYLANNGHGFEDFQDVPPHISIASYARRPVGVVDYVIVFGRSMATPATLDSPAWSALAGELANGYRVVARTDDDLVEVYERAGSAITRAGDARRAATDDVACQPGTADP
jgi:hypothetical protein